MGRTYETIDDRMRDWVGRQPMFFVATAPLTETGRVNLSPKGFDGSFVVLDPTTIAYLDLMGSGVETLAHVKENRRITVMFCAFEGPPRIVRFYGDGEAVEPGNEEFDELVAKFPAHRSVRSVIRIAVDRISDSCGYGVPLMEFQGERDHMDKWIANRSDQDLAEYRVTKNALSLDGLPGAAAPSDVRG